MDIEGGWIFFKAILSSFKHGQVYGFKPNWLLSASPNDSLLKKKKKALYIGIKADTHINGTLESPEKTHTDMDN